MDEEFERALIRMLNQMMSALASGAMGVKISVSPEGDVRVDPIRPRKKRIYVPFEVVDAGDSYLVALDLRHLPKKSTRIRVEPRGILVETPRGERYIYFEDSVVPQTAEISETERVVEISVKKGEGKGEKVIRFVE